MPAGSRARCSSLASLFAASPASGRMIAIQRFCRTARTQCVLVVEHRANLRQCQYIDESSRAFCPRMLQPIPCLRTFTMLTCPVHVIVAAGLFDKADFPCE